MNQGKHVEVVQTLPKDRPYRLRWRMEWADGRVKYGGWNYGGQDASMSAWRQNTSGLLFAVIEAKDGNGVSRRVAECSGQDFCSFRWVVDRRIGGGQTLVGLSLVTRTECATVFCSGATHVEARDAREDALFLYGKEP